MFGGKLLYLPKINEEDGISCADYKYYPNGKCKGFFLEEKETHGKSKSLLDCTDSNFNDNEIYERVDKVFKSYETQYIEIIIVKNKNKLFGIFQKIKKR